eukprot:m.164050 g.164050  ORF g.164050 m.164050 type:complete len:237 (-) comp12371_c0_seq1:153-863(-)
MTTLSREDVADLLRSIERYNPGNLPDFARYIKYTCESETYDIEAYLAVLKLYQFNPEQVKLDIETTRTILLKALTALPKNDFSLCLYLLPESCHHEPAIEMLIELYKSLDTCYFEEVWDFVKGEKDLLKCKVRVDNLDGTHSHVPVQINGWVDSIRSYIAHVIEATYQVVDVKVATSMLGGLTGAELKAFAEKQGWQMAEGDKIFVVHQEERVKSKNIVESIRFDSLVPIMATMSL